MRGQMKHQRTEDDYYEYTEDDCMAGLALRRIRDKRLRRLAEGDIKQAMDKRANGFARPDKRDRKRVRDY